MSKHPDEPGGISVRLGSVRKQVRFGAQLPAEPEQPADKIRARHNDGGMDSSQDREGDSGLEGKEPPLNLVLIRYSLH